MSRPLKSVLSMTKIAPALTLLTLFLQGCTHKETLITTPVQTPKIDFVPAIAELPVIDFNRTAKTEQEASLMIWDLYLYTSEMQEKLKVIKEKINE